MLRGSLGYVEGVVDVSIIVPVCFENPLKRYAVEFLSDVLSFRRRAIIPVTTILGAYHIVTRYLGVPRLAVKKILTELLRTRSPALYPQVPLDVVMDALDYAVMYNIESWDGYLIALAQSLGAKIVYTLDEELGKVREVVVVNPFPKEKVEEYHKWLRERLRSNES